MTFITAASFANLLAQIAVTSDTAGVSGLAAIAWQTWTVGGVLLILTARFFYGNMRYLDCNLDVSPTNVAERFITAVTVINIIVDSLILSFASFFVERPKDFALLIAVLLGFEVVWFTVTTFVAATTGNEPLRQSDFRRILSWQINNFSALIVLIIIVISTDATSTVVAALTGALALNTAVDAYIGRETYFKIGTPPREDPADGAAGESRTTPSPDPSASQS